MNISGYILCKLGRHDVERELTRDGPAPALTGGVMRWSGYRMRCTRCLVVTVDLTYPPWATKEQCEWWEGRPFGAVWHQ